MHIDLPVHLRDVETDAYLVGGAVRDLIRGRQPKDYDVVVAGDPDVFARNLAYRMGGRVVLLNKDRFALFRVVGNTTLIDVTQMTGNDIASDLFSRDFTINAVACRLDTQRLIDCTGGIADIAQGTIRMVSEHNLQADPIRLLRAYRMAADMDYGIEHATRDAIRRNAHAIQRAAGERIWTEWQLILKSETSHRQISAMAQDGLLEALFPELTPLRHCTQNQQHHAHDAFSHTLAAYQALEALLMHPQRSFPTETAVFIQNLNLQDRSTLKLALLLHDIGKPAARGLNARGHIHFHGHASAGATMAEPILRRLRAPNRIKALAEHIILQHQRPLLLLLNRSDKGLGRFFRLCGRHAPLLLLHAMADTLGKAPRQEPDKTASLDFFAGLLNTYCTRIQHALLEQRLVSGKELIDHFGLPPSPLFKTVLNKVEEARLAGLITDKQSALQWIDHYLRSRQRSAPPH
jgi:poly(A) polymerase